MSLIANIDTVANPPPTSSPYRASRPALRIDTSPHSPHFRNDRTTRLAIYKLLPTSPLADRQRTLTRKAHTISPRLRILGRQKDVAGRE